MKAQEEKRIVSMENELLEIFILIEENNHASTQEALTRYAKLMQIKPTWGLLHVELNQHYKDFLKG